MANRYVRDAEAARRWCAQAKAVVRNAAQEHWKGNLLPKFLRDVVPFLPLSEQDMAEVTLKLDRPSSNLFAMLLPSSLASLARPHTNTPEPRGAPSPAPSRLQVAMLELKTYRNELQVRAELSCDVAVTRPDATRGMPLALRVFVVRSPHPACFLRRAQADHSSTGGGMVPQWGGVVSWTADVPGCVHLLSTRLPSVGYCQWTGALKTNNNKKRSQFHCTTSDG